MINRATDAVPAAGAEIDPVLRARIADFMLDYAHAIDDGRIEDWTGFFTDDAVYQIITRESHEAGLPIGIMTCEGRGMMADRVQALRTANIFEPHTYCHLLGGTRLEGEEQGRFRARTNFSVFRTMQDGTTDLYASGKYLDRLVLEAGAPKLAERRVVLESRRVDVLLVLPL